MESLSVPPVSSPAAECALVAQLAEPELAPPGPWDRVRAAIGLPHVGYSLAWTGVLLVAQIVIGTAVGLVCVALYLMRHGSLQPDQLERLDQDLMPVLMPAATLTTLVTALIASRLMFGRALRQRLGLTRLSWHQCGLVVLLVPPLQILASEANNCAAEIFPQVNGDTFAQYAEQPWPIVWLVMCVLPGVGEEIFFRGFLSRGLIARHGVVWGTFWTALLFALVHVDPVQATGAFVLGLALQYIFLTTRSLTGPILLHILNNSLAFLALRYGEALPIPGITTSSQDQVTHTPLLLIAVAAAVAGVLLSALYACRTRWLTAAGTEWSTGFPSAEIPPAESQAAALRPRLSRLHQALVVTAAGILGLSLIRFLQD